ncbi:nucleotidyltransferase family protein [Bradymonas sediminis]|uniref:Uncharacterized protein n=1 Tax=Bradymonas sediminis TaxID=1548548 RepID=A0A2Z4FR88_9DELT|nr:nucleotidyltransferase family protein [Bradymonas sediminis]AWV91148.1 hypothetical protein DN745_18175 [Bradymonas sediminis]TDP73708.1 putative nucleotidyltransferase-like protein [Bradymonas sediminis]
MKLLTKLADQYRQDPLRALALNAMAAQTPLNERSVQTLRATSPEKVIEFAKRNEIGPIIAKAILDHPACDDLAGRDLWQEIYDASHRRMTILMDTLDRVANKFAEADIPLVGLKNAGIARGIYPDPAACPMGDLDVLIPRKPFLEAHALLLEMGFVLETRSTVEPAELQAAFEGGGTEYRKEVDGETVWFELQWRPVAGRWIRAEQEPSGDDLIADAVTIEDSNVLLLEPTANLLQVSLHTAKHTYVRAPGLRLHTDVDRIVAYADPDWEKFVAWVKRIEVITAVYFSLALSKALLGTDIPDWVLRELQPPRWKRELIARWLQKADIFEPNEKKFNRAEMIGFHTLLYDDAAGFTASVFDTDKDHLTLQELPQNLRRGASRVADLLTRYDSN